MFNDGKLIDLRILSFLEHPFQVLFSFDYQQKAFNKAVSPMDLMGLHHHKILSIVTRPSSSSLKLIIALIIAGFGAQFP
jgi:hypothetical protein